MTIATALFLGLALIATAILYAATRDRWRWGRWFWRIGVAGTSVLVLLASIAATWGPATRWWNRTHPTPVAEIAGIRLGMIRNDLRARFGDSTRSVTYAADPNDSSLPGAPEYSDLPPGFVLDDTTSAKRSAARREDNRSSGTTAFTYDYSQNGVLHGIFDQDGRVASVAYAGRPHYQIEVAGIRMLDRIDEVFDKLGPPSGGADIEITGGLRRTYGWTNRSLWVTFERDGVIEIGAFGAAAFAPQVVRVALGVNEETKLAPDRRGPNPATHPDQDTDETPSR